MEEYKKIKWNLNEGGSWYDPAGMKATVKFHLVAIWLNIMLHGVCTFRQKVLNIICFSGRFVSHFVDPKNGGWKHYAVLMCTQLQMYSTNTPSFARATLKGRKTYFESSNMEIWNKPFPYTRIKIGLSLRNVLEMIPECRSGWFDCEVRNTYLIPSCF